MLLANLNTKFEGVGGKKKLMRKINTIKQSSLFFFT